MSSSGSRAAAAEVEEMSTEDVAAMIAHGESSGESDFEGLQSSDSEDEEENQPVQPAPQGQGWKRSSAPSDRAPNWLPPVPVTPGVTVDFGDAENITPASCFDLYFTDEVVDLVVTETNRYAEQKLLALGDRCPSARIRKWQPMTAKEFRIFLVLLIAMGIVTQPAMSDHWTTDWLTQTPGFAKVMSRNRFQLLLSCIHFTDNTQIERDATGRQKDPLAKLRRFMELITAKFRSVYYPRKEISIDEQMIGFKGRLTFKQFLPNKPTKWGIKAFVLAESTTSYVYEWDVYTGRDEAEGDQDDNDKSKSSKVVRKLVKHLHPGHVVYMDNYYSSPALFRWLSQRRQMAAVGTVRTIRKGLPKETKDKKPRGSEPRFWRDGNMIVCSWPDKKQVTLLSTIHDCSVVDVDINDRRAPGGHRSVKKPTCIANYNTFMGGVDKADQMLQYYEFPHRHRRWYLVLFHQLCNMAVHNSWIVFNTVKNSELDLLDFQRALIEDIFAQTQWPIGTGRRRSLQPAAPNVDQGRLTERHFQERIQGYFPDCVVCSKRPRHRKQCSFRCRQCEKPMCPGECFERFHTLAEFRVRYND